MNIPIASMFDTFARCGVNVLQIHHNFAFRNAMIPRWSGKEHPANQVENHVMGESLFRGMFNLTPKCRMCVALDILELLEARRRRSLTGKLHGANHGAKLAGAPGRYPERFRIRSFWWIRMILPRWLIHFWVLFEMYGKIFCWCIVAHG